MLIFDRHVWLIGMMGAGKSVVGRLLSQHLGRPFVDVDSVVASSSGRSISSIFAEQGEDAFRDLERSAIASIAAGDPSVIATGGGTVLDPSNVAVMGRTGLVVLLSADLDALTDRLSNGAGRPLLDENDIASRLNELWAQRSARYRAAADVVVETTDLSPEEVADVIEASCLST